MSSSSAAGNPWTLEDMQRTIKERSLPSYREFLAAIRAQVAARSDVNFEKLGTLTYKTPDGEKSYDYITISSREISPKDPVLLLRAGIHGDEVAGPLTLMQHLGEIFGYAHDRNVKLIVFPLDNPSGFEYRLRYNVENDIGWQSQDGAEATKTGNNDFLRYETADGRIVDDLLGEDEHARWYLSSDEALLQKGMQIHLPQETRMLHAALKNIPLAQIVAHIDLHQDYLSCADNPRLGLPGAYHYGFCPDGNVDCYDLIVAEIEKHTIVFRDTHIGGGQRSELPTDARGGIVRHDGTLGDYLWRAAALRYCVTAETTGAVSAEIADRVNLIWIHGILDLVAADYVGRAAARESSSKILTPAAL